MSVHFCVSVSLSLLAARSREAAFCVSVFLYFNAELEKG